MRPDGQPWTWRERAKDPRAVALIALAAAGALLASAVFGSRGKVALGLVLVVAAVGFLVLVLLPPWRDPEHSPRAAALVLVVGAVIVAAVAIVVS